MKPSHLWITGWSKEIWLLMYTRGWNGLRTTDVFLGLMLNKRGRIDHLPESCQQNTVIIVQFSSSGTRLYKIIFLQKGEKPVDITTMCSENSGLHYQLQTSSSENLSKLWKFVFCFSFVLFFGIWPVFELLGLISCSCVWYSPLPVLGLEVRPLLI